MDRKEALDIYLTEETIMKKILSFLLACVLSVSFLAGCSSEGSNQSSADGTDSGTETTLDPGLYLIFILDADTMEPIENVRVQFCSDTQCMLGKTDSSGVAEFHSNPGTYTAHLVKTPGGYVDNTEEYTLTENMQVATFYLEKDGTEIESEDILDEPASPKLQAEWDLAFTGFTFTVPDNFKDLIGDVDYNDRGELEPGGGVVDGYMTYQGRTDAEQLEFEQSLGEIPDEGPTEQQEEAILEFCNGVPNVVIFRVIGLSGDKDINYLTEEYFTMPLKVAEKIGTAGDYTFYYVVMDFPNQYWDTLSESFPKERFEELQGLWEQAANTKDFLNGIKIKEPKTVYASSENSSAVSFETLDLEGNTVTSKELFADHKITMINLWGTWCTHCQEELSGLEELSKEWAEKDVQIIGICTDAYDEQMAAEAMKILEKNGVKYINVRMTDEMLEQLPFIGLPTSYFVDSEGNLLDYPVAGARLDKYPEKVEKLLAEMD